MDYARRPSYKISGYTRGFSLISLTMGLGLGLLAVELAVYWLGISRKQWAATSQSLSASRDTRTLFLSLQQDINACGYWGLRENDAHYPVEVPAHEPQLWSIRGMAVSGLPLASESNEKNWSFYKPVWRDRLLSTSDILLLANIPMAHWAVDVDPSGLLLRIKGNHKDVLGLDRINKTRQHAVIADAKGAAWREIAVDEQKKCIKLHIKLHRTYGKELMLTPIEEVAYFVARSSRDPKQRYALWRQIRGKNPEELLQGLTQFCLHYALSASGICDVDHYVPSDKITDWSRVCRVRVTWRNETLQSPFTVDVVAGYAG